MLLKSGALCLACCFWLQAIAFPLPSSNQNVSSRLSFFLPGVPVTFNVKDYGAKADGHTNDAAAINKAINAAARAGGGTVYFPAGTYVSGSVRLQSNITLYLGQGTVLQAIDDPKAYDAAEPNPYDMYQDYGHSHWHNGFIWGENLHDIAIEGHGIIYGKGLTRNVSKDNLPKGLGDKSIALKNCHNVLLRDFYILHGGHFGILVTGVDNLTIDNLIIDTNRDGMDIDCCKNVRISNCVVNSPTDDGICPKSTYALGYFKPTENLTITNCTVSGGYREGTVINGTFEHISAADKMRDPVGRIKLGTESSGGFKNITISNCVFDSCRGLALEAVDGGSLEDITITNITMRNILNAPIFIRLGSRLRSPEGTQVGELQHIHISNVVIDHADSGTGCIISGIPGHDIKDVSIRDVRIIYKGGGTREDAARTPPEKEKGYPEPSMFGVMPSYGFYIRHVQGIDLTNIHLQYQQEDMRPPFVLDDVQDGEFRYIKAPHAASAPVFVLKNVQAFKMTQCNELPDRAIAEARDEIL